ncbi:MAG: hypothetical protein IIC90_04255 [Chloroflexi bacterium]|nr:hypothetical protein [Chloroflexota bacterium]
MMTENAAPLEIERSLIGTLHLDGLDAPYVNLDQQPLIHSRLRVGDTEYAYESSIPVQGHSAVLPEAITQFQSEGRQVLIAERSDRYFIYLA